MHKTTKFYKWRQRFLRRNQRRLSKNRGISGYVIQKAWEVYNTRRDTNVLGGIEQVPGKEFRE